MNWPEMVLGIVLIATVGRVLQGRYGAVRSKDGEMGSVRIDRATATENVRLHEELRQMKERIAVLERLATDADDGGARLDREIERLRDRP